MRPPDSTNPAWQGGARKMIGLTGLITSDDSEIRAERQALRIAQVYRLPWPTAKVVAQLAFTVGVGR